MPSFGFTPKELGFLKKLNRPVKIQAVLDNQIRYNRKDDDCFSPRLVLRHRRASCLDGAVFAAAALRVHGFEPLLVDLRAVRDEDHILAVFQKHGKWGAIAKSKFLGLRYRDPAYASIRELVMSYFNHHYNWEGERALRECSKKPLNLARFDSKNWMTTTEPLWFIGETIDAQPHQKLISPATARQLTRVEMPRYRKEIQVLPGNPKERKTVLKYGK
ncbi:MAG: hypothetical protein HY917_02575 [Candidatus Diapherotrites archaeon]|nr:hypothetical protein [Candidatus Diapherotrites archaeon]